MPGVAIVTDTTQYLPAEILDRHGVHLVSLYVNWDGRTDRESDLGDYDAFYDHMRTAATLPSTSQPSVGDFLDVWRAAAGGRRRRAVDPPVGRASRARSAPPSRRATR